MQIAPPVPPVMLGPRKRLGLAVVLAVLFGPAGLFYASTLGGLVMLVICVVVGVGTLGFGLLVTWPTCVLWAVVAVLRHNACLAPSRLSPR